MIKIRDVYVYHKDKGNLSFTYIDGLVEEDEAVVLVDVEVLLIGRVGLQLVANYGVFSFIDVSSRNAHHRPTNRQVLRDGFHVSLYMRKAKFSSKTKTHLLQ